MRPDVGMQQRRDIESSSAAVGDLERAAQQRQDGGTYLL